MKPHEINKLNNGIAGFYINKECCNNLIEYFENSEQYQGVCGIPDSEISGIDESTKISTDVRVPPDCRDQPIVSYLAELTKVCDKYKEIYKTCDGPVNSWGILQQWNIQKYKPNEGFFRYHCEKYGWGIGIASRHLVFMTYLNNVSDGGETEFYNQKLLVKPETGLTLIWSADWFFTHRGITSPTQTKYITTGWYDFYIDES